MARRRFFVPEVRRGTAELAGAEAEHLVRVLRVEAGQVFEISDNSQVYLAEVIAARKSFVQFQVLETLPMPEVGAGVTILPALFKFDSFEWMIEKATELGVTAIQPFEAVRSERGLLQASLKRRTRWERIALEASQQSRRAHLPEISATVDFASALASPARVRLMLDESPGLTPVLNTLRDSPRPARSVSLIFGPEGGWTEAERSAGVESGWVRCSLGAMILRAETAIVSALAVTQAFLCSVADSRPLSE
ncbi:MAG: 16S rRNA (uracil(1498)-N(3))-methyltransferase [Acidobacteriaceae bacterium]|nr:16S rRNA (uracil(1498)-N(3))-methyltransferase [Acidobacteriaceae bacterium]